LALIVSQSFRKIKQTAEVSSAVCFFIL